MASINPQVTAGDYLASNDLAFIVKSDRLLDIVIWAMNGDTPAASSESDRAFFSKSATNNFHLALAELPAEYFWPRCAGMNVTALRTVLMKSEPAPLIAC